MCPYRTVHKIILVCPGGDARLYVILKRDELNGCDAERIKSATNSVVEALVFCYWGRFFKFNV